MKQPRLFTRVYCSKLYEISVASSLHRATRNERTDRARSFARMANRANPRLRIAPYSRSLPPPPPVSAEPLKDQTKNRTRARASRFLSFPLSFSFISRKKRRKVTRICKPSPSRGTSYVLQTCRNDDTSDFFRFRPRLDFVRRPKMELHN